MLEITKLTLWIRLAVKWVMYRTNETSLKIGTFDTVVRAILLADAANTFRLQI